MSNVMVLKRNYMDPDVYVGMTYSSQVSVAPASNLSYKQRRSKVWRSAGFWEITSANRAIVFRKAAGVDLTANIAVGTYTSDSTFLTAVKSALDTAAAGPTFTVSRDATSKKIQITSNGSGGTIFQLMCSNAGFTAAALLGFDTTGDLTGSLSYTADALRIHTSEWIRLDLGTASLPRICALLGQRNSPIKVSESAVVKLQASHTDAWSAPAWETTITHDDEGLVAVAADGLGAGVAYRYWRIEIADPSNTNGYIELSKFFLGEAIVPSQGAVQFPLDGQVVDLSSTTYSENGVAQTEVRQQTEALSFTWNFLTVDEFEEMRNFVRDVGTAYPWLIVMDAQLAYSSSLAKMTRLVRFPDGPRWTLPRAQRLGWTWSVREEV
jgi:hypothetical protein